MCASKTCRLEAALCLGRPKVHFFRRLSEVRLYQDEYKTPPSHFAMSAYDAGRLLVKALTQLEGRWDSVQVVHQMKTLPLSSPRDGKVLKFDTHGDPINPEYIFRTERQG